MYIILNYRGTKEYAEKSEVRERGVSFPRQSSHLCLPRLKQDCSPWKQRLKQDCLPWKQGLSHTLLQGLHFWGRGDLWTRQACTTCLWQNTTCSFWRTWSFLKTGDTTWTPCGAVAERAWLLALHRPPASQFWLYHSSWETSHLTCELQLSWPWSKYRCFILWFLCVFTFNPHFPCGMVSSNCV